MRARPNDESEKRLTAREKRSTQSTPPAAPCRTTEAQSPTVDREEDEEVQDDDDESEGAGVDLRPGHGSPSDSSEEEEEDSGAEREVRKGFIVDEDESTRRRRRKKRSKKGGDDARSSKRRRDSDEGELLSFVHPDASNANLGSPIAQKTENMGIIGEPELTIPFLDQAQAPAPPPLRLRRRSASAAAPPPPDLPLPAVSTTSSTPTRATCKESRTSSTQTRWPNESNESATSGASDEDRDDRAARRKRKDKKRKERKAGGRKGFDMGMVEGITAEAWQEVAEVFGNGQDYAWAMEDDEDNKEDKELKDIFEPSEIASRMLTAEDDKIRTIDIPERLQLASTGLPEPVIGETGELEPLIPEEELRGAVLWMATNMPREAIEKFVMKDDLGNTPPLYDAFLDAIEAVLRFVNIDFLEPPFIWHHRSEYLVHFPPGAPHPDFLLLEDDLWRISALSIKYRSFIARRNTLKSTFRDLQVEDAYFDELMDQLTTVEEIADAQARLSMKYGSKLAEVKKAKELEEEDGADGEATAPKQPKYKRVTRETRYKTAKQSIVAKLAEAIGISSSDLALDVAGGTKSHFAEDPNEPPRALADQFVGDEYPTWERALEAAKSIVVHEMGHDPLLRKEARRFFRDFAQINVAATKEGQNKIDPMNPFYAFKYLKDKPITEFIRSPQWLQILAAEAEGLVTASIVLPQAARDRFVAELKKMYLSDYTSALADEWNDLRTDILKQALEEHFVPLGAQWARSSLKEDAEELVGTMIKRKLESRVDAAPWCRDDGTMEPGQTPSVLALSHGFGDPKRDSVVAVYLDSDGHFREHLVLDRLDNMEESQHEAFAELLKRHRPQVVVVGGNTRILMADFRQFAANVSREILDAAMDEDDEDEEQLSPDERHRRREARAAFESTYVNDEVARIYQNSQRANVEFSELSTVGKYCIGLARYAQSPLNEYAALGPDLAALTYDPNQKFLAKEKVIQALERALIEVTNRVGVDINKAVRNAYYAHLLPYISGFGPRKADGFLKKINAAGGTVITRYGLVTQGLLHKAIFINSAAFLRIRQDDLAADLGRDTENEEDPDVLDDTRIHPEDYDVARKMAADAMEYDEEDLVDAQPSKAVADLLEDDVSKLNELALDEFAEELSKVLNQPKRLTLYKIRDEMKKPYRELRRQFQPPTPNELFTMLTGETTRTLDSGLIIPVRVLRVSPDDVVLVRLDCGIDGQIAAAYRTDATTLTKLRSGQTLQGMVMSVDLANFQVELTTQESLIAAGDKARRQVKPDQWFDQAKAAAERESENVVQHRKVGRAKRMIQHPNFQSISAGQAEEYLFNLQRGDAVIRPSSREHHLAVTWKVDVGLFQHLGPSAFSFALSALSLTFVIVHRPRLAAVHELNKADESSIGSLLRVDSKHTYSDLDELLEAHVKQMARKTTELTNSDKWKGSKEQLDRFLDNYTMANPGRASYGFAWNPDRQKAGEVLLGFKANEKSSVQYWNIRIVPEGFTLFGQTQGDVASLVRAFTIRTFASTFSDAFERQCNGFKTAYAARMTGASRQLAPPGGGRTPFAGGTGPYASGGRTPHLSAPTPNPYLQQYGAGGAYAAAGYGGGR
ncbi:SPOSA6832_04539 [Sporobolomyces salmonicolor]|uniref:SPOSA6832_04539-mRNA-1:cds n=1 Tax=Sporidiobolus salmonicolor TaxID=5005 RepID=A0A0D6ERH2_SPOSA|nr:SPOSA6832_04539 [Sporobolomyces salmonicolor]